MGIPAKAIKALDNLIGALEELKEVLEHEANKSGNRADDEGAGEVSRPAGKAKAAAVSGKGKAAKPDPDDNDSVGGDNDDGDDGGEDNLPPAKTPVKNGKATAAKGKKSAADEDEVTLDTVKEKLTTVLNNANLGKEIVKKILGKYGATRSAELDEEHYEAVCKICDKKLAEVAGDDGI